MCNCYWGNDLARIYARTTFSLAIRTWKAVAFKYLHKHVFDAGQKEDEAAMQLREIYEK